MKLILHDKSSLAPKDRRIDAICRVLIQLKTTRRNIHKTLACLPPNARRPMVSEQNHGRYLVDEIELEGVLEGLERRIKRAERHLSALDRHIQTNSIDHLQVGLA